MGKELQESILCPISTLSPKPEHPVPPPGVAGAPNKNVQGVLENFLPLTAYKISPLLCVYFILVERALKFLTCVEILTVTTSIKAFPSPCSDFQPQPEGRQDSSTTEPRSKILPESSRILSKFQNLAPPERSRGCG